MLFPPSFLDEIRNRLRVSDVVRRKVSLRPHGHEFMGLCPFHKEKTPSFTVNDAKGFYHCFGCAAHGNVFDFVTKIQGLSFVDAVKELAAEAGLSLPEPDKRTMESLEKSRPQYDILEAACRYFQQQLALPEGSSAREYLSRRGLTPRVIERFRIGFAPDKRYALKQHMAADGITDKQLLEVGLVAKNDRSELYDKFRGRVIFPIADSKGRVIAFGGRILGDGMPKYLNSPETPLFKKGEVLYNENLARTLAFKTGKVVVAEGYMDVIAFDSAGIKTAMAPLGTAITESHLRKLWKMAPEPVICLDGDAAGIRAMHRAAHLALPLLEPGVTLKFALLPESLDPDDYIRRYGIANMRKILQSATSLSEAIWDDELSQHSVHTPEQKANLEKRLFALADSIRNPAVAKYYKDFFRQRLWEHYKNIPKTQGATRLTPLNTAPEVDMQSLEGCQRMLLLLIWSHPELMQQEHVEEDVSNLTFSSTMLDKIREAILEVSSLQETIKTEDFHHYLEKNGLSDYIPLMERLQSDLLPPPGIGKDKALEAFRYYTCLSQLHTVKHECDARAQEMTEASEELVMELRKQVAHLEAQTRQMETAFAES